MPNDKFNLSPREAAELLEKSSTFVLDVRTPREFLGGSLPKATLIPVQELPARLSEMPTEKSIPILVYCAHGVRSVFAQKLLRQNGYEAVYNLAGGLAAFFGHE